MRLPIFRFLATLCLGLGLVAGPAWAEPVPKRVLVYGDSLSWGWVPTEAGFPAARYAPNERWTTILGQQLGPGYEIIVNGLSGRTTDADYPEGMDTLKGADFNGARALPGILAAEMPLDLVVVMLGTNDLRVDVARSPDEIAAGAMRVARLAAETKGVATPYAAAKVLVVTPPPLGNISATPIRDVLAGGPEKSRALASAFAKAAEAAHLPLFDAGTALVTDGVDGVHFTARNNVSLGLALAPVIRSLLNP